MKSLRTLIVDDEPPARNKLRALLSGEKDVTLVGEATNGDDAIRQICELRPQLVFLDIQMPDPNGISVLHAVKSEWKPCTIFTTAHAGHAVEAFALDALDYLLKPYSRERFSDALNRARRSLARPSAEVFSEDRVTTLPEAEVRKGPAERFLVKTNERYLVVRASEITRIEAASNYVILHTPAGNHVLRRAISQIEADLDAARFYRASRSTIVNLDNVREVQLTAPGDHVILLHDGARVALTRGLREFQDRLQAPRV